MKELLHPFMQTKSKDRVSLVYTSFGGFPPLYFHSSDKLKFMFLGSDPRI